MKVRRSRPPVPAKWTRRSLNRNGTRKFPCCRGRCTCPHKRYISAVPPLVYFQLCKAHIALEPEPAAESGQSNGEETESMTFAVPRKALQAETKHARRYPSASFSTGSGIGS